jgi:Transposase DDE domain
MRWWQIRKRNADLERELRSDLELEEEEQRERGVPPKEAAYAARCAFGNISLIREQTHEAWGLAPIERFWQDLLHALRSARREPLHSIVAVLALAFGSRCLQPMAEAARLALGIDNFQIVADAGYSNGEQAAYCEAAGMLPYVPVMRTVNNQGDGTLFGREDFRYEAKTNTYICPGDKTLRRKKIHRKDRYIVYEAAASDCGTCSLRPRCTQAQKRSVSRHLYEDALNRMQERVTPAVMRRRRCTAEHPFATIKYRIFGHPRLLMRGLSGARVEIGLATMAYNIKRMTNVLGASKLTEALNHA